jgi:hypothetical protein
VHNCPWTLGYSTEAKNSGSRLFAEQQKTPLPYLAGRTGSLPAFVSQHAAKKPVRNSQAATVIKGGLKICLIPPFRGK